MTINRWKIIVFHIYLSRSKIYLSFFSHFFSTLELRRQFVPRFLFDFQTNIVKRNRVDPFKKINKKMTINRWKIIVFHKYIYLDRKYISPSFLIFFPPSNFSGNLFRDSCSTPDDVIIFTRLHILHGCNMYVRARAHRHVVKGRRVDFQAEILQHPRKQIPLFFVRVKQTENCGTVYSGWGREGGEGWNTSNICPGPSTTASTDS